MPGEQDRRSAFATMMRRYLKDDNGIQILYHLARSTNRWVPVRRWKTASKWRD